MFDGHNAYIAAAYIVTAIILGSMIAHTLWRNKRDKVRLEQINKLCVNKVSNASWRFDTARNIFAFMRGISSAPFKSRASKYGPICAHW